MHEQRQSIDSLGHPTACHADVAAAFDAAEEAIRALPGLPREALLAHRATLEHSATLQIALVGSVRTWQPGTQLLIQRVQEAAESAHASLCAAAAEDPELREPLTPLANLLAVVMVACAVKLAARPRDLALMRQRHAIVSQPTVRRRLILTPSRPHRRGSARSSRSRSAARRACRRASPTDSDSDPGPRPGLEAPRGTSLTSRGHGATSGLLDQFEPPGRSSLCAAGGSTRARHASSGGALGGHQIGRARNATANVPRLFGLDHAPRRVRRLRLLRWAK